MPVPSAMCVRPGEPRFAREQAADEVARPRSRRRVEGEHDVALERVVLALLEGGVHGVVDERPRARARRRRSAEEPELAQRACRLARADRDVGVETAGRRIVRERLARHEPDAVDLGGELRAALVGRRRLRVPRRVARRRRRGRRRPPSGCRAATRSGRAPTRAPGSGARRLDCRRGRARRGDRGNRRGCAHARRPPSSPRRAACATGRNRR